MYPHTPHTLSLTPSLLSTPPPSPRTAKGGHDPGGGSQLPHGHHLLPHNREPGAEAQQGVRKRLVVSGCVRSNEVVSKGY